MQILYQDEYCEKVNEWLKEELVGLPGVIADTVSQSIQDDIQLSAMFSTVSFDWNNINKQSAAVHGIRTILTSKEKFRENFDLIFKQHCIWWIQNLTYLDETINKENYVRRCFPSKDADWVSFYTNLMRTVGMYLAIEGHVTVTEKLVADAHDFQIKSLNEKKKTYGRNILIN